MVALEKARVESERSLLKKDPPSKLPTTRDKSETRPDVLNVLIASPGDVTRKRQIVTDAIQTWNASHAHPDTLNILLNPIRWETHSYPESGNNPETLLNSQIVKRGDFLIGIFGVRIGTPTAEAESGTIEEIEIFRKANKFVSLYFSDAPVPRSIDRKQLDALADYRQERQKDTLYAVFKTDDELRDQVLQHLTMIVPRVAKPLRLGMWRDDFSASANHSNAQANPSVNGWKPDARIEITADNTSNELILSSHLPFTLLEANVQTKEGARLASLPIDKGQTSTGFRVKVTHDSLLKVKQMNGLGALENDAQGRVSYKVEHGGQIIEGFLPFVTEDKSVNNAIYIHALG
jgi:hypothetical protein